jgi:hypothetical protein
MSEGVRRKIRRYLELNNNKNTLYENLQDVAKKFLERNV